MHEACTVGSPLSMHAAGIDTLFVCRLCCTCNGVQRPMKQSNKTSLQLVAQAVMCTPQARIHPKLLDLCVDFWTFKRH